MDFMCDLEPFSKIRSHIMISTHLGSIFLKGCLTTQSSLPTKYQLSIATHNGQMYNWHKWLTYACTGISSGQRQSIKC